MFVYGAKQRGNDLELNIARDDDEDKDTFFATLSLIATIFSGKAYWCGASDKIAIILMRREETNERL